MSASAPTSLPGGYGLTGYTWIDPVNGGSTSGTSTDGNLDIVGNLSGQSANGRAYSPGKFSVMCVVHYSTGGEDPLTKDVPYVGSCAAIGGHLTLSIQKTNENYAFNEHDEDDVTKPFFIHYYKYSHLNPLPSNAQQTQDGRVSSMGQIPGTVLEWTVPSPLLSKALLSGGTNGTAQAPRTLDIVAEQECTATPITCRFTYTFTDCNPPETLTAVADCTTSTYDNTAHAFRVNTFSAHMPYRAQEADSWAVIPPVGPNETSGGTAYRPVVKDRNGQIMRGVWIQERFPVPPTFPLTINQINDDGAFWVTDSIGYIKSGSALMSTDYDYVAYRWTFPGTDYETFHFYYGGTVETDKDSLDGCVLNRWNIFYHPGSRQNTDDNGADDPGECFQVVVPK